MATRVMALLVGICVGALLDCAPSARAWEGVTSRSDADRVVKALEAQTAATLELARVVERKECK